MRIGRIVVTAAFGLLLAARGAVAEDRPCAEQCGVQAEQAFQTCIEQGGSDEDCKAAAAQTFQTCVDTNCQTPPAGDCQSKCEESATGVQNKCLANCDAGDACADICQHAHDEALTRCVSDLCDGTEGCQDAPDKCCHADCQTFAHGVFTDCIATEGEAAKELCSARADEALKQCTVDHCNDQPEVPCEDRCNGKAEKAGQACLDNGGTEDACAMLKATVKQQCIDENCSDPGPSCEETCQQNAEAGFQECVAGGGTENDCAAAAQTAKDQCIANQCNADDCPARCAEAVAKVVAACVDAGFDQDFCDALGEEAQRHCVEEHCSDESPDASCKERCADHARHDLRRCIEDGGVEADCKAAAQTEFDGCVQLHCNPQAACANRCQKKADRVKRKCLASDKTEDECTTLAGEVNDACMADHCAPEPPDTCDSNCEAHANEVEKTCLAAGNSADDCTAAKQGVLDQCTTDCAAPDQTCTEVCEGVAQDKHDKVFERTNSEPRATVKGQRTYRRCEKHC
ncbi:MAG TPA: hypothetical protein VMS22_19390 [Candidatus Eisenbacteria bacterium]|nr:hypothetical protein [Candidatus Eisenbacteria bacterium]